jgi:aldose 1-epimerase
LIRKTKFSKKTKKTIVNFTNHSYFNLGSSLNKDIFNHKLLINATNYLESTNDLIPTGNLLNVQGTNYNFLNLKTISCELDNCWALDKHLNQKIELAAILVNEEAGRKIEVYTDEPGMQIYTGNNLNFKHKKNSGVCLETQHFPNSPNQQNFPSTELLDDELYESNTIIKLINI